MKPKVLDKAWVSKWGGDIENMAGHVKTHKHLLCFQRRDESKKFPFPEYCQDLTHYLRLALGVLSSTEGRLTWPVISQKG